MTYLNALLSLYINYSGFCENVHKPLEETFSNILKQLTAIPVGICLSVNFHLNNGEIKLDTNLVEDSFTYDFPWVMKLIEKVMSRRCSAYLLNEKFTALITPLTCLEYNSLPMVGCSVTFTDLVECDWMSAIHESFSDYRDV